MRGWRRLWEGAEVLVASDSGIPIALHFAVTIEVANPDLDEAVTRARVERDWQNPRFAPV